MKIVVNTCFGSFELPKQLKHLVLKYGYDGENAKELRTDAELIAAVESSPNLCDGMNWADLKVVEIPADATDWMLDEEDGVESVIYVRGGKLHIVG